MDLWFIVPLAMKIVTFCILLNFVYIHTCTHKYLHNVAELYARNNDSQFLFCTCCKGWLCDLLLCVMKTLMTNTEEKIIGSLFGRAKPAFVQLG